MKISAHLDPLVLERELLRRVDALHPRSADGRSLILVPTSRLADHVQRRLTSVRRAWLGLEVWPFRRLALEILGQSGGGTLRVASRPLLEALLEGVLHSQPDNLWTGFAASRPGALRALLGSLNDLREAGISPGEMGAGIPDEPRAAGLLRLYRAYHASLENIEKEGFSDDAGLVRAALAGVEAFAGDLGAVLVHGIYELIGGHLELLGALNRSTRVEVLLPAATGGRVSSYSESYAAEFLLADGDALDTIEEPSDLPLRPALRALYDERCRPPAITPGHFSFRHTQGATAEVRIAVREALRAVRDGCPPEEIALVARSLEPFAPAIEEVFAEEDLPWTSSLGSPLRRHPVVRDFLLLLETLGRDFPRGSTAEILRSPRLRWRRLRGGAPPPPGNLAEKWSREARIIGGLEEWTVLLPRWAQQTGDSRRSGGDPERAERRRRHRVEMCGRIATAVLALQQAVAPARRGWKAHAARLIGLLGSLFNQDEQEQATAAVERLGEILDDMARLETVIGDRRKVDFDTMRSWLDSAVDGCELTLHRQDRGGVRVLDTMQLRGLTFRHVHLLGFNSGLTPRPPREDPLLTDELRRALRRGTRRPLGIKSEGSAEERLLLALAIGTAREHVAVSWQRADEAGKARTPSLALREVARLAYGRPDLPGLREAARHLRSHPGQWLEDLLESPGLLAPSEEVLLRALHGHDAETFGELVRRFPDLRGSLVLLQATQAFNEIDSRYDARIGPRGADARSVTALESLGRCPLQFFFSCILNVRELDSPADPYEPASMDIGNQLHGVLEALYGTLRDEGAFAAGTGPLVERGLALLAESRTQITGDLGRRQAGRLPVLWNHVAERWLDALCAFVGGDLTRAGEESRVPSELERPLERALDFGGGRSLKVRGRIDRRMTGPAGDVIGDYKTSVNLDRRSNVTKMLKAETLQLPLYWMLDECRATVELLGIHPDLEPSAARRDFDGFGKDAIRESFLDTMRTLLGLLEAGRFPLHAGAHCNWCAYQNACRRNHPPTQDREAQSADAAAYRRLQTKTKSAPDGR